MTLTPEEIATYTLKRAVRGYAIEDVDELLDQVADEVERLGLELEDARQRLVTYEERERELGDSEEAVKRALITASRAAEETLGEASTRAEEVVREAEEEAQRVREEVEVEAGRRRREIEEEILVHHDEAVRRVEEAQQRLSEMMRIDAEYRSEVRTLIGRQQDELARQLEALAQRQQDLDALDELAQDRQAEVDASARELDPTEDDGAEEPAEDPVGLAAASLSGATNDEGDPHAPWIPPSYEDEDEPVNGPSDPTAGEEPADGLRVDIAPVVEDGLTDIADTGELPSGELAGPSGRTSPSSGDIEGGRLS